VHLPQTWALLLFGVTLIGAAPRNRTPESLEGDWQTVIASPRRPWIFTVHLERVDRAWAGSMSVEGLANFPLRHVQVESTRVRFQFPPELDSLEFEGRLENEGIIGEVPEHGRRTPTRLTRIAPLPAPRNRVQAWQQDLDIASARLLEYDRSFTLKARESFRRTLAQLRLSLPHRNDAEILVALSQAVAQSDNAHTRLRLDPTRQGSFTTEFPIRTWWFSDGPCVIRAGPEYERALGCRLIAIDGHELSGIKDKLATLFAGNAARAAYLTPIYLVSPDILYGLQLIPSMEGATFRFEDARRVRFDLWVRPELLSTDAKAAESWQELSPLQPVGSPPWKTALGAKPDHLPLFLRHPEKAYWFEFRPDTGMLYFQFNRADNDETGPTFQEFGDSLTAFIDQQAVRAMVVDLRFNSGGNLDVAKAFMSALGQKKTINQRGRLFAIIGRCPFSAGLYHAAQLKQFTQAIFVGEAVGDWLDYWAEGGEIVLPNSHAAIWYSNGFHCYSGKEYPAFQPYYEELSVPSLDPDISTLLSSGDYFSGRDPALAGIETRLRQQPNHP
jgi:hypothetical protein